jgi:hypothetical protein
MKKLGTVIIGGGPAGLSILLAARRSNLLQELVEKGLRIIEKTNVIGSGEIGNYSIRSDSLANSFIASSSVEGIPVLQHLLEKFPGSMLAQLKGHPVNLTMVADYLTELGNEFRSWMQNNHTDAFITGTQALCSRQQSDKTWITDCQNVDGFVEKLHSQTLVLATGATQTDCLLYKEKVAGESLLPKFIEKTVLSKEILGQSGELKLAKFLNGKKFPKVAIVGGSHSAIASAYVCLHKAKDLEFSSGSVTILHRHPLSLTYSSPEAAREDGYTAFNSEDICPKTGRVFPLAGFRCDSRELIRKTLGLGGLKPELRLRLFKLEEDSYLEAKQILEEADLIIASLGYRPRALPLLDCNNRKISTLSELGINKPLVDERSRVLDANEHTIPGVFAIGLSAGYPLAGRYGEPSFTGQANGLALWQSDIGEELVLQLLKSIQQ